MRGIILIWRQGKHVSSLVSDMYKYLCPRSSLEEGRICLSCKEEYTAIIGDLNAGVCPNCFSENTDILE